MNDHDRHDPTDPMSSPEGAWHDASRAGAPPIRPESVPQVGASFRGRTPGRTSAVRAGMIVGTGLVVAMGAAVAMGASPDPSATSGGQTPNASGQPAGPGPGGPRDGGPRGLPFGGFGPFGGFEPGGPDGQGKGFAGPGRDGFRGLGQVTVTAVAGSSVSLATDDGWTRTIAITSTTTITKGGAAASAADISVGDIVRFAETRGSDGTFTITKIEIVLPQVAGTVTAVAAGTITITLRDGTSSTISTSGTTTYRVETSGGSRSDVTIGATIVATGDRAADGSLAATTVWVRLPRVAGTVSSTGTATISVSRRDGTSVTIHVGSDTMIRVAGVDAASLSDIKPGMVVVVQGSQRADGSIDARAIGAGDRGLGKGRDKPLEPHATPSPAPAASGTTSG